MAIHAGMQVEDCWLGLEMELQCQMQLKLGERKPSSGLVALPADCV